MSDQFIVVGSILSPYSIKVRSYFRYKQLPHEWAEGGPASLQKYQDLMKLPLVPLVVTTDRKGMQDSTPIIEKLEAQFPEPSLSPSDEASAFVSALLEEYGDEWGNKWMVGLRWHREVDQDSAASRLAKSMDPEAFAADPTKMTAAIKARKTL